MFSKLSKHHFGSILAPFCLPFWLDVWFVRVVGGIFADMYPMKPGQSSSLANVIHAIRGHLCQSCSLVGDQRSMSCLGSDRCPCLESLTADPLGASGSGLGSIVGGDLPFLSTPPTTGHRWFSLGFNTPSGGLPRSFDFSKDKMC